MAQPPSPEPSTAPEPSTGPHPAPPRPPVGDDQPHLAGLDELREAAYEAERETGAHEGTLEEVRRNLGMRMLRMVGGFVLIGVGASLLVLPGPGWILILIGLSLLPFAWAERTILAIRRKVPGVPEDGSIPARTWFVIAVVTVGAIVISFLFGARIGEWIGDTWSSIWN